MTNETTKENELELKKLIADRFEKLEEKINEIKIEIVKSESSILSEINKVESKIGQEIVGLKVDTAWIKWLFGGLLSFILILLSLIITVLFKLIEQ